MTVGTITEIRGQKRRKDRVSIFIDDRYALSMSRLSLISTGLSVGQEVSDKQLNELGAEDTLEEAMNAALRFLGQRPRSEREVRMRLRQRRLGDEVVDTTLSRLRERGLVHDGEFARFWVENRTSFRPVSRRMLDRELRQKGVDGDVSTELLEELDDGEGAYRAGLKKSRSLRRSDRDAFRKKMLTFLRGRGFSYSISSETTDRIWRESGRGD